MSDYAFFLKPLSCPLVFLIWIFKKTQNDKIYTYIYIVFNSAKRFQLTALKYSIKRSWSNTLLIWFWESHLAHHSALKLYAFIIFIIHTLDINGNVYWYKTMLGMSIKMILLLGLTMVFSYKCLAFINKWGKLH